MGRAHSEAQQCKGLGGLDRRDGLEDWLDSVGSETFSNLNNSVILRNFAFPGCSGWLSEQMGDLSCSP